MRAARLLQMLLLLQNRGRLTTAALARELEVARRTVLRDVDALTEAGLPVVTHRGAQGGVELGFNYRTRLTGLARDEAEALAVMLSRPQPELAALGLGPAGARAAAKVFESQPDAVRATIETTRRQFRCEAGDWAPADARVAALAEATRARRRVMIRARSGAPRTIHPIALIASPTGWRIVDALAPDLPIALDDCGDINISSKSW